jgi:ribosomal protein S18 acetylase RimI-like enzyme
MPGLAQVRRFEAVGFRAFPAGETHFDGTWAIRLTPGYAAKRVNSISALDPSDRANIAARVAMAADRFARAGRPLVFRQSPLCGAELLQHFSAGGWSRFGDCCVMTARLDANLLRPATDRLPYRDAERWAAAVLAMRGADVGQAPAFAGLLASTEPETGLFLLEDEQGEPIAAVRCVRDRELAGIFDLATAPDRRRAGYARMLTLDALKWAAAKGARIAWLQVADDNVAATGLYRSLSFAVAYRYCYRMPPS